MPVRFLSAENQPAGHPLLVLSVGNQRNLAFN
jgi:hypothetical protein